MVLVEFISTDLATFLKVTKTSIIYYCCWEFLINRFPVLEFYIPTRVVDITRCRYIILYMEKLSYHKFQSIISLMSYIIPRHEDYQQMNAPHQ